jgi:hypothetical protein
VNYDIAVVEQNPAGFRRSLDAPGPRTRIVDIKVLVKGLHQRVDLARASGRSNHKEIGQTRYLGDFEQYDIAGLPV